MGDIKISIITPSFNQGEFIEQTILSILDQGYPNLEYILLDGASTDNTVNIIKKYEKQLAYWVSEKDNGQADAINKGLKKATGEIVAWLNSDDRYFSDSLTTVAKAFSDNPDVDLIYGNVENLYSNGKQELYINKIFNPIDFLSRVSIHQPSVFWRKRLHDKIGFLDQHLHYLMDYDLWMRIFFKYKTLKIEKTLSRFRIHHYSKTFANPPGLYLEYRKVFSRFINSLHDSGIIRQLQHLCLYDNVEEKSYDIGNAFSESDLHLAVKNYVYNCAVQEYSWGNISRANKLLLNSLINFHHPVKTFYFLLKNNLGIRKL